MNADPGFHLSVFSPATIRGEQFSLADSGIYYRLFRVWLHPLADASVILTDAKFSVEKVKFWWLILVIVGMLAFLFYRAKGTLKQTAFLYFSFVVLFLMIYAMSPFYYESLPPAHYVAYRHLTYILPFLSLLVIAGLSSLRYNTIFIAGFLLIGLYGGSMLLTQAPMTHKADKMAGWVLARKMGHDPDCIAKAISNSELNRDQLVEGVGWGVATALFENVKMDDAVNVEYRIEFFIKTVKQYPDEWMPLLMRGVEFAFSNSVSPALDNGIKIKLFDALEKSIGRETSF
jgi:hypothetical protein